MNVPPRRIFADVRRFDELDSTNAWLLHAAQSGLGEGTVVVAEYQRAGRGRLGRDWESPRGSGLLASILLRPKVGPEDLFCVSALVTLCAREACSTLAGLTPGAKWPNDLVVDDAKVAGVLAEVTAVGAAQSAVVVGIGINLSWPGPGPAAEALNAVCLDSLSGRRIDAESLLDTLLDALERRRRELDHGDGRVAILGELAKCTVTIGRRVRVELAAESFEGMASGLDEKGRLLVDTDTGRRSLAAGDVVHLR